MAVLRVAELRKRTADPARWAVSETSTVHFVGDGIRIRASHGVRIKKYPVMMVGVSHKVHDRTQVSNATKCVVAFGISRSHALPISLNKSLSFERLSVQTNAQ